MQQQHIPDQQQPQQMMIQQGQQGNYMPHPHQQQRMVMVCGNQLNTAGVPQQMQMQKTKADERFNHVSSSGWCTSPIISWKWKGQQQVSSPSPAGMPQQ